MDTDKLKQALNTLTPGLSGRSMVQNSECFEFQNGFIGSYNGEVIARVSFDINIKQPFFVNAEVIMNILKKFSGDVKLEFKERELVFKSGKVRSGVKIEPTDPRQWNNPITEDDEVHSDFQEALFTVFPYASKNHNHKDLDSVLIEGNTMVANSNEMAIQYKMEHQNIPGKLLIRADFCRKLKSVGYDITHLKRTDKSIYLANDFGTVYEVYNYEPELNRTPITSKFVRKGSLVTLKSKRELDSIKGLSDESSENGYYVKLDKHEMLIGSRGDLGWIEFSQDVEYSGEPMTFTVTKRVITDIFNEGVEIYTGSQLVRGFTDKYSFVATVKAV